MLIIADLISAIIQSILISYFPYYCMKKDGLIIQEGTILKLVTSTLLIFFSIQFISIKIGESSLSLILMDILNILILLCFYFKNYNRVIVSYSLISILLILISIVFGNIHWPYIQGLIPIEHSIISEIIVMYLPIYLIEISIFIFIDKIYETYKFLSKRKHSFEILLLILFLLNYISPLSLMIHNNDNVVLKNIFILSLIAFVAIVSMYFVNLKKKMYEIDILNKMLNEKNDELRKIKHDYGSQISYINGLYIMEQYERLGIVLKDIISGNNSTSDNLRILSNSESIISIIVTSLITDDVNVIVEEESDLSELKISKYELQKIISNIVNNAVTAINSNGLIVIKTYKIFNSIYINIKNDGPKIDDKILDKIFNPDFTTKRNKDNGFGLTIVKELVIKNNGKVSVTSNDDYTEFKIVFKI